MSYVLCSLCFSLAFRARTRATHYNGVQFNRYNRYKLQWNCFAFQNRKAAVIKAVVKAMVYTKISKPTQQCPRNVGLYTMCENVFARTANILLYQLTMQYWPSCAWNYFSRNLSFSVVKCFWPIIFLSRYICMYDNTIC